MKKISVLKRISSSIGRRFYQRFFPIKIINKRKFKKLLLKEQIKLDLGSGPKKGIKGWTTVDTFGSDILWDLTKPIPLYDSSVREVYTSHLLEHLSFDEINRLMTEIYRILVPGGSLRICVPDASKYIKAYLEEIDLRPRDELYQAAVTSTNSSIDQVNYIAYMGGEHCFLFDSNNICNMLKAKRFLTVSIREPELEYDDPARLVDSLYVLALK